MFTQQEEQVHQHQCWALNFSELDGEKQRKGRREMGLSPILLTRPYLSGALCWWDSGPPRPHSTEKHWASPAQTTTS